MSFAQYGKILRRWWWLPVIGLALFGAIGYGASTRIAPTYQATSRVFVNQVQSPGPSSYNDVLTSERLAVTYTQLLQGTALNEEVIRQLNLPLTAEQLKQRTKVSVVRGTQLIQLDVQDGDPARAAAIADTLVQRFVRSAQELQTRNTQAALTQVDGDITTVQAQIADTSNRLNALRAGMDANSTAAQDVQRLQQQLAQYDQDLRDIRYRTSDVSSRLNQLKTAPDPAVNAGPEVQRLQEQLNQLDQDQKDARQRYTDTAAQLDKLRATPVAGSVAAADVQRLQDQLTQYQEKYRRLLDARQTITQAQAQGLAAVSVVDMARLPERPVAPTPLKNGLLAGALGLLLLAALALLLDAHDDRVHDTDALARQFGVPVYGAFGVRRGKEALLLTNGDLANLAAFREAIRTLRTRLLADAKRPSLVVAVSSAKRGEGRTTLAANLAMIEAQAGKRVALIDADVRNAGVHKLLGIRNNHGLSAYLARTQYGDAPKMQDGPYGIKVLTAGWVLTNLPDLLGSERMATLVRDLRTEFDVVVLDTAPILSAADTLALQPVVDGTLLAMDARRTGMRRLERALAAVRDVSGTVFGIALTRDAKRGGVYGSRRARPEAGGEPAVEETPVPAVPTLVTRPGDAGDPSRASA